MSKYILPIFSALEPQFIDHSIRQIKKSHLYNSNYDNKPSNEKFEKALAKITKKEHLEKKDLKTLSHYLTSLEKLDLFDTFYQAFVLKINEFISKTYIIRPFLSYIYNGENRKYKENIFNLLKVFARKTPKYKEKYSDVFSLIMNSNSVDNFNKSIEIEFSKIEEKLEINTICERFFIKSTDKLFHNCLVEFIYVNYLKKDLWDFHYSRVKILAFPLRKHLFKKILLQYNTNSDVESYPNQWFKLIGKELGDPYDPVNQKWRGLEDEKEIFRRWNVSENIDEFFDRIVGGDKRRKSFWRQYVNNIYRIEYFEEASQALVMEFQNHLFVEFAKQGNAMYYYDKYVLGINEIKSYLSESSLRNSVKTQYLKQMHLAIDKLNHSGAWQYRYDYTIRSLGYKKSGWL